MVKDREAWHAAVYGVAELDTSHQLNNNLWGHCCFPLSLGACKFYFCPLRLECLFPLVLWKSCNQILLAFKVRFPGDSQSLCPIIRLGSLTWGSEPSQQWENFFGIIVLQFVIHPPAGIGLDYIVIVPFLPSCSGFLFVFGHGVSFFLVGSSVLLWMVVISVLLQEESASPSTPPS